MVNNVISLDAERTKRFLAAAEALRIATANHAPDKFLDNMAMKALRYARASAAVMTEDRDTSTLRHALMTTAELLSKEAA
jgi:hypothetical protein